MDSSKIDLNKPLYIKVPQDYEVNKDLEREFDRERYIGKIFESRNCGKFKVLGVHGKQGTNRTYICEFIDTGYKIPIAGCPIDLGTVQDKLYKSVQGIACEGLIKGAINSPLYGTWSGILDRCYNKEFRENNLHYMKAKMSDRWLRFDYFLDDVVNIPGFKECVEQKARMEIDKDVLFYGNCLYSKDTCCFIPKKLNTFFSNEQIRHKKITTGYIGVGYREKQGVYRSRISINGKPKYLGGFKTAREAYEVYHKAKKEILEDYLKEFDWLPDEIKIACRQYLDIQYNDIISRNT